MAFPGAGWATGCWLLLLDSAKKEKVINAFRAGAKGVFSKNSPLARLSKCVRCVYEGQVWINHEELELVLDTLTSSPAICAVDAKGLNLLTERERAIVESVAEGLANHEIAERLGLSRHTVKNYLFRIFDKLGVSNRGELIFLTFSRNSDIQQDKISARPMQVASRPPTTQDGATAYLQCLRRARHPRSGRSNQRTKEEAGGVADTRTNLTSRAAGPGNADAEATIRRRCRRSRSQEAVWILAMRIRLPLLPRSQTC